MREKRGKLMKVIVVSHGSYARGLVDTAQMIAGEQEDLEAFGLEPEESVDTLRVERVLNRHQKEKKSLY